MPLEPNNNLSRSQVPGPGPGINSPGMAFNKASMGPDAQVIVLSVASRVVADQKPTRTNEEMHHGEW